MSEAVKFVMEKAKLKLWREYENICINHNLSFKHSRTITLVASGAFKDFPENLPEGLRDPLKSSVQEISDGLEALSEEEVRYGSAINDLFNQAQQNLIDKLKDSNWDKSSAEIFQNMLMLRLNRDNIAEDVSFQNLIHAQALIMIFAHLDAFMADSLRIICQTQPELLRSDEQVKWADVLSCGSWDTLINYRIEECVYKFGWKDIVGRIKFLKERVGLKLQIPEQAIGLLEDAERIRHIVVHNGGKVSQEYIDKSKRKDVEVGEFVPVSIEYLNEVSFVVDDFTREIRRAVAEKFFGLDVTVSSYTITPVDGHHHIASGLF